MIGDLEALVVLSSFPQMGSVRIRQLIKHFGSALAALDADPASIAAMKDFGPRLSQSWKGWKQDKAWQRNLELVERHNAHIIDYTNPKYPKRLLEISDHPVLLYVQGDFLPCDSHSIAVVGTRNASIYGNEVAERISQDLAAAGFTVVSGLARGVDTSAHKGALKGGRTIAVIGSGLSDIYPQENTTLAKAIANKGVLISEFPMATPPDRQNFPQRNRIVSGMTLGTLLIEAPVRSGAMITIDRALSQKRRVFALPGRVDSENFRGNHHLIKSGQAQLVENASDIIDSFSSLFGLKTVGSATVSSPKILVSSEEELFLRQLNDQEISIDHMVQITKLPVMKVNVLVTSLVLKKVLKEFPGKVYKKNRVEIRQGAH